MNNEKINFDTFELDFLTEFRALKLEELNIEPNENGLEKIHSLLKDKLPNNTNFVGSLNSSYENYTSWLVCENYYITPLYNNFNWALFRVYWNELDMIWEVQFDARLKGCINEPLQASKKLLEAVWTEDGIDINSSDRLHYLELLNSI